MASTSRPSGVVRSKDAKRVLNKREPRLVVSQVRQDIYLRALMKGHSVEDIARKLDPSGGRKYRRIRGEVLWTAAHSPEFLEWQDGVARGEMVTQIDGVSRAVVRRAKRGRADAAKMVFEATDFHNPKVKHEHGGEVTVTLNIPRPERVENPIETSQALEDGTVVDATVVEEE